MANHKSKDRRSEQDENRPAGRKDRHKSKGSKTTSGNQGLAPLQERNGDAAAARIQELEAQLAASQADNEQLRAEQAQPPTATNDLIPRPQNVSKAKMSGMQQQLGMSRARWLAFRGAIREGIFAARLDRSKSWHAQSDKRILKMVNVVRADFPEANRFDNAWGIKRIASESFSNHKSYGRCVDDHNTYRGRKRLERRENRANSDEEEDSPTVNGESRGSSQPSSRSPSPSPSTVPQHRTASTRSDDEDDEDDLISFDDGNGEPPLKRLHRRE
ncbi:hypothetical protein MIND_01408800 [Mycena indigotica]|uniref:Uncharacterized protein n=1 Tax=Mycena indigotica TaxID=2126181 RepID=A0A8H6S0A9_9AGAR|nr:uncharacterized protein MIND_01408800 [Mycena indigotica]KAF7288925.1 hypothetical protein MIND_01408800 [Mycena indigotica]